MRRPRPPPPWTQTRRHRRSRGGRPASSTRGCGARCSTARRWPRSPRATSCAARQSASPTDGAIPGPRPSRRSSADTTPRSWSRHAAGRAGEATEGRLAAKNFPRDKPRLEESFSRRVGRKLMLRQVPAQNSPRDPSRVPRSWSRGWNSIFGHEYHIVTSQCSTETRHSAPCLAPSLNSP